MAYMDFHEAARSVSDMNAGRKTIEEQIGETAQASTQASTYDAIRQQDSTEFETGARKVGDNVLGATLTPIADLGNNLASLGSSLLGDGTYAQQVAEDQASREASAWGLSPYNAGQIDPKQQHNLARDLAGFMAANKAVDTLGGVAGYVARGVKDQFTTRSLNKELRGLNQEARDLTQDVIRTGSVNGVNPTGPMTVHQAKLAAANAKKNKKLNKELDETLEDTVAVKSELKGVTDDSLNGSAAQVLTQEARDMSVTGNLKTHAASTMGRATRYDVIGTVPMVDQYKIDGETGQATPKDPGDWGSEFGEMAVMNAMFSGVVSGAGTALKINKARKANELVNERDAFALDAKESRINFTDETLAEYGSMTQKKYKGQNTLRDDISLEKLYDKEAWGVFETSKGNKIIVSPKLGAVKLYKDKKTGEFYSKRKDENVFTDEALVLPITKDGANRYLIEPRTGKNKNNFATPEHYGFNSIKTEEVTTDEGGNIAHAGKDPGNRTGLDELKAGRKQMIDAYGKDEVIGIDKSEVKVRNSVVQKWANLAMGRNRIDSSKITNETARDAVDAVNAVRDTAEAMFDKTILDTNTRGVIDAISAKLSQLDSRSTANPMKNMIKALTTKVSEGTLSTKKEFNDILRYALEEELIKTMAKVKTDSKGRTYIPDGEKSSIASGIVNSVMDMTGVTKRGGERDQLVQQLTEAVSNVFDTEKILGDAKNIKGADGMTSRGTYLDSIGKSKKSILGGLAESLIKDDKVEIQTDIANMSETARTSLRNDIYRLGSNTNVTKQSADFSGSTLGKYKPKQIITNVKLDNQSLPINSKETTAGLYTTMGNTVWHYRNETEARVVLDEIQNMSESEAAKFLDLADNIDITKPLESNFVTYEAILEARDAVRGLRMEAAEHKFMLDKYDKDSGMTFDIMKVPTNRLQYTGYINPQQGVLSKAMFTTTPRGILDATTKERYYGNGVRTALDEHSAFLELLTSAEKTQYKIPDDVGDFNIKKWDIDDVQAAELAVIVHDRINDVNNPVLNKNLTIDARQAKETLEGVATDTPRKVMGEVDGITNMKGIADAMLKIIASDTGIDGSLVNAADDMYTNFMNGIESAFEAYDFKRADVKHPNIGGVYGMDPVNIGTQLIAQHINKMIQNLKANHKSVEYKRAIDSLQQVVKEIETKANNMGANPKKQMDAIKQKMLKDENANKILKAANKLLNDKSGTDKKINSMIFNAIDRVEALDMTLSSQTAKMFEEFQMYYAFNFIKRIENEVKNPKNKITESMRTIKKEDIDSVSKLIARDRAVTIEKAMNKSMGKDAMALKDNVTKIFERGYVNTMIALGARATEAMRKRTMKELLINKKDQAAIRSELAGRENVTMLQFAELLHKRGYDTLRSTEYSSRIPGFRNPMGDKINYVNMKGIGFDEVTGMSYTTFSPIDNPFPFLLHSLDSSIMGAGTTLNGASKINMRWDAVMDDTASSLAHDMNRVVGNIYGKSNIGTSMNNAYKEQRAVLGMQDPVVTAEIIRDMARKRIALRDGEMTKKDIDAEATIIKSSLDDNVKLHEDIGRTEGHLTRRNKEIEQQGDVIIEQYSDGTISTKVTKADRDAMQVKMDNAIVHSAMTIDPSRLKNIDISKYTLDPNGQIRMLSVDDAAFKLDIEKMGTGKSSAYNKAAQQITLDVKPSDVSFFPKLAHEAIHAITLNTFKPKRIAKEFMDMKLALEKKGLTILRDGKKITNTLVKEDISLEGKGISKMNVKTIYGNELSANLLDNLIANELIYTNSKMTAKLTGKTNLTNEMKPLELLDQATGDTHRLYTVSEFNDFLTGNELNGFTSTISDIATRVNGLVNGSAKVRDVIFDKKMDPFQSTIKDINTNWKNQKGKVEAIHQKIAEIPFFEIAEVNPTKEALLTAIGYTNGAKDIVTSVVAEAVESVISRLEQRFGGNANKYSKVMGDAVGMGFNKLMYSNLEKKYDFLNITHDKMFSNGRMSMAELREFTVKVEDQLYVALTKNNRRPEMRKTFDSIMNDINNLAEGNTRMSSIEKVTSRLEAFVEPHMRKKEFDMFDSRLTAQKMASLKRIQKNDKTFNSIYDLMSKEKAGFSAYMEAMNTHENPYSLFGENIEFQFLENGKEGRIVDPGVDVKPEDVIAVITDENGNKHTVISVDASERLIATQESNMMTVNITDFEKGVYEAGGDLHVNAQNVRSGTHNVDQGIHKQIARNMYIKVKDELSKDLGYRQWHMLREQGIYLSEAEKIRLEKIAPGREFVQISKENPHSKVMGNDYWIDKRYAHMINGTDGIDLAKFGRSIAGDTELAKTITTMSKIIYDGTKVLRNLVLIARPSSYINSFVSSMGIYWIMKDKGTSAVADLKSAKGSIKSYRQVLKEYARAYSTKDGTVSAKAWKNVEKHELHSAMQGGLMNTIRADAYKVGSLPEAGMYSAVRKATGSHEYANATKTIGLDPTTHVGAKLGTVFDYTELLPKVALYLNLKKKQGAQMAVQKTTMSFPSYQNLPHFLNMIDQVSPYTKFLASTPRMIGYGLNQAPFRMGGVAIMANTLPAASFMFASEEEQARWNFYKENDFIKMPFIPVAYSAMSLFPTVTNPFSTPFGNTPFDVGFFYNAGGSMLKSSTYLPGTYMN